MNYVIHRGPLASTGGDAAEGTVFTFQESRAVERLDRTLRSRQRPQQFSARYRLDDLVGESPPIERVRTLVRRYAKSDATVLVLGESGTGKELTAVAIHERSSLRNAPFVAINCGAIPPHLLQSSEVISKGVVILSLLPLFTNPIAEAIICSSHILTQSPQ